MDLRRERDALDAWRAIGNGGKLPLSLMQLEELLKCYQTDEPFELKEIDGAIEGRGQRCHSVVNYNDGLNDGQWAMNFRLEDSEDLQELVDRARGKKERWAADKLLNETDTPSRNTLASNVGVGRKGNMTVNDYDAPGVVGKPKRGIKFASATPSVIDDDDEERDIHPEMMKNESGRFLLVKTKMVGNVANFSKSFPTGETIPIIMN
ncbi:hypothetical protein BDR04DRAFT_1155274 [Suillus decipiens]|nr:hypothetical protein BDR04DRAFT_1155274 [Suillus decipiens]